MFAGVECIVLWRRQLLVQLWKLLSTAPRTTVVKCVMRSQDISQCVLIWMELNIPTPGLMNELIGRLIISHFFFFCLITLKRALEKQKQDQTNRFLIKIFSLLWVLWFYFSFILCAAVTNQLPCGCSFRLFFFFIGHCLPLPPYFPKCVVQIFPSDFQPWYNPFWLTGLKTPTNYIP